jgi:hypothetical protein
MKKNNSIGRVESQSDDDFIHKAVTQFLKEKMRQNIRNQIFSVKFKKRSLF